MCVYRVLLAITAWSFLVTSHPVETAQHEARQVLSSSSLALGTTSQEAIFTSSLTTDVLAVIDTAATSVALSSFEDVINTSISGIGTMQTTVSDTRSANSTSTDSTSIDSTASATETAAATTRTASATNTNTSGGNDGSTHSGIGTGVGTTAAIGGSIGGAAAVAVVIWWCLPARKQRKRSKETAKAQEKDTSQPTEKPTSVHTATAVKYRDSLEHSTSS
ncbi:hypothetical protein Q7P35_009282 [Cladosporium inversicolor]